MNAVAQQSIAEDRNYDRMLRRIRRHVPIEHSFTTIADKECPWIRVVDPDTLLLKALSRDQDGTVELDPFWAAAWRAAVGLDRFLDSLPNLANAPVLELGGGSGRAGIAAALRGAKVLITDAVPLALLVCKYNARCASPNVQVRCLDWRDRDAPIGKFPIILGSDIVYDPKLFPILEPCVRRYLFDGGVAYFSEPQRHTGDRFETWIQAAGWNCKIHFVPLHDNQRDIRIFECRLPRRIGS